MFTRRAMDPVESQNLTTSAKHSRHFHISMLRILSRNVACESR